MAAMPEIETLIDLGVGTRLTVITQSFGRQSADEVQITEVQDRPHPWGAPYPNTRAVRVERAPGCGYWIRPRKSTYMPLGIWNSPVMGQPMAPVVRVQVHQEN